MNRFEYEEENKNGFLIDNKYLTLENITNEEKEKIKKELLGLLVAINRTTDSYNRALEYENFLNDTGLRDKIELDLRVNKILFENYKNQLDYYNIPYTEEEIHSRDLLNI